MIYINCTKDCKNKKNRSSPLKRYPVLSYLLTQKKHGPLIYILVHMFLEETAGVNIHLMNSKLNASTYLS